MTKARYDDIADFYVRGWSDVQDPATAALLELLGDVRGSRVLDIACGHGRLTRELAQRGALATGADLSAVLLTRAMESEHAQRLGTEYIHADVTTSGWYIPGSYDAVTCNFGLSDIDDLNGCMANVAGALAPGGRFVFSILHPCFPGGHNVSGAWPTGGTYYEERWWMADAVLSPLRRQVGANHRMLSTYLNALTSHGLLLDAVREPAPDEQWAMDRPDVAGMPLYLVVGAVRADTQAT